MDFVINLLIFAPSLLLALASGLLAVLFTAFPERFNEKNRISQVANVVDKMARTTHLIDLEVATASMVRAVDHQRKLDGASPSEPGINESITTTQNSATTQAQS